MNLVLVIVKIFRKVVIVFLSIEKIHLQGQIVLHKRGNNLLTLFSFCSLSDHVNSTLHLFIITCSENTNTHDSTLRRLSPNDKKKQTQISEEFDVRSSDHVNVIENGEEHYGNTDDTVQLVRREENEHAIS